jgi:GNAT superfamily N-acetyltransferase
VIAVARFVAEALDGLAGAALMREYAAVIAGLYPGWTPDVAPRARPEDFSAPGGRFIVAYDGERPVGCGGIKRLDENSCELKRLYVAPDARGRGLARRLVEALERAARDLGYTVVRLDTGARQPEALALFSSAGYGETGDYNGNEVAAHWFEKRL